MSTPGPGVAAPAGGREWPGVLGGVALTLVLHAVASVALMVAGLLFDRSGGSGGGYWFLGLWMLLGLAQWVYVAPAALFARSRGWRAVAKGLWIGGAIGTLLTGLCWGGLLLNR